MGGGFDFALELVRQEMIVAAERKLARSLNANERAGLARVDSLLRLESYARRFAAPEYPAAQVLADLARFAEQAPQI